MEPQPIANEEEYTAALAQLALLMDIDPEADPESEAGQKIEALAQRIKAYEDINYPMEES